MCLLSGKLPVDSSASVTVSLLRLFVVYESLEWILAVAQQNTLDSFKHQLDVKSLGSRTNLFY